MIGSEMLGSFLEAGIIGFLFGIGIFISILVFAGLYVYFALAWQKIAKKVKHKKPWLAWIPFANLAMWLQMGKFHWAWIFLLILVGPGWIAILVLLVISHWRVFKKLKYAPWLSLAIVIDIIPGISGLGTLAYGIIIGIVAWKKK